MSKIDMPEPKKLHSIQIDRLPMGGYMLVVPHQAGSHFPVQFLAGCSTMPQVLDFLRQNMEQSAFPADDDTELPY